MAYLESTPLELSNGVEILVKTTENTLQYRKPPYKYAYTHRSHDRVQPPLALMLNFEWHSMDKFIHSPDK